MTTASLNSPKDYALYYLNELGFSVFILKSDPPKERKRPVVNWEVFQKVKPTVEIINKWFNVDPNYNLAIITGSISKIVAIDLDGVTAAAWMKEQVQPKMSTNLWIAYSNTMGNKTGGGGTHIVFRIEDDISDISQLLLWTDGKPHSEIKVQGNGHYIAAAPSVHPNNEKYEWNGKEPETITRQELDEFIRLAKGPRNLEESRPPQQEQPEGSGNFPEDSRGLTNDEQQTLLRWLKPYYTPGNRDKIIFHLSGAMRKEGFTLQSSRLFVEVLCEEAGWPDEDLDKSLEVVDNSYKEKPLINGKTGLYEILVASIPNASREEYLQRSEAYSQICQIINRKPEGQKSAPEPDGGDRGGGGGDGDGSTGASGDDNSNKKQDTPPPPPHSGAGLLRDKTVDDEPTRIITFLATEVMSRVTLKAFLDTQEIIYYDERRKHYLHGGGKRGESIINAEIEKIIAEIGAPYSVRSYIKDEVVKCIVDKNLVNRADIDADPYTINLENCLLDVIALERMEQSPEYLTLSKFPIVYNPDAECPRIERFLGEVVQDTHKLREVLKFIGYILLKSCKYEKMEMLLGGGSNGKSVFIKMLEAFVGRENVSNVSLQEMEDDRFARARLFGKTLNCYADNKSQKLKETGNLKTVISGDTIEAQEKFKPRFSFRPRAKIVVSTNNPPETDDKTHAYYRRIMTVNFERTFVATTDETDPNKRDADLIDKLTTPEEMSGLLNLALRYLKVLIKENGFAEEPIDKVKREYERQADHVSRYLGLYCTIDPLKRDQRTRTEDLYAHYVKACREEFKMKASEILGEDIFGSRLVEHGVLKQRHRVWKGEGKGRLYFYEPIVIRAEYNTEQTSFDQVKEYLKEDGEPAFTKGTECIHCALPGIGMPIARFNNLRDYQLHVIFKHPEINPEQEEAEE